MTDSQLANHDLRGDTIAKSGLRLLNRSQIERAPDTLRSQYKDWLLFNCGTIHLAISSKIRLCLSVWRARASGELQLDRTCLLVWSTPHLGQRLVGEQFHSFKLLSVGSWLIKAFLAKF